jgi:FkbM family methyltransferase
MKYDRQTEQVIARILKPGSCTIDVGCHKGEMLEQFIKASPKGDHYAFEPIPDMFAELQKKFTGNNIHIFPYALAAETGSAEFNFVKNAPAYSGLKQRKYAVEKPEIEKIKVAVKTLDETIPEGQKVDFIKIDVEGGEMGVLQGGKAIITKNKPVIIFECGLGASEFYNTKPEDVFDLVTKTFSLNLSTMHKWLKGEKPFSEQEFMADFNSGKNYYFIAYP